MDQASPSGDGPPEADFEAVRSGFLAALVAVGEFIRIDRVLGSQVPDGRASFFGHRDPAQHHAAQANRFLEWFALERKADGSGGAPIQAFLASGCPGLETELRPFAEALAESTPGVWAIRDGSDGFFELESAFGGGSEAMAASETGASTILWLPETQTKARIGQSVIGRLVQVPGRSEYFATDGTSVFAGTQLYDAFAEEIARRGLEGSAPIEPSQLELEQILVAYEDAAGESPEAVERELGDFLPAAVLEAADLPGVEELSYALSVSTSPGRVLGPFLESLAFSTELDIEKAQRLLLRLWNAHHASARDASSRAEADGPEVVDDASTVSEQGRAESVDDGTPEAATAAAALRPDELGPVLAAEIEKGLAEGEDVEALFGRVESMIGEPVTPDAPLGAVPEELRWHTDDEGDFSPLVEEYLWERSRSEHPPTSEHGELLRSVCATLGSLGVHSIDGIDENSMAASLVQAWAAGERAQCMAQLEAYTAWNEWLVAVQEITLDFDPIEFRDRLLLARARCESLSSALERPAPSDAAPVGWKVTGQEGEGWLLRSSTRKLRLDGTLDFEVGDLILGTSVEDGFAAGMRVVPSILARAIAED